MDYPGETINIAVHFCPRAAGPRAGGSGDAGHPGAATPCRPLGGWCQCHPTCPTGQGRGLLGHSQQTWGSTAPALSGEGTRSLKPGPNAGRRGDSGQTRGLLWLSHTTGTRWGAGLAARATGTEVVSLHRPLRLSFALRGSHCSILTNTC